MRRVPAPMLRSAVITKLPIWPEAEQCVPPPQFQRVALDPDGPDLLAVLLVEERIRAGAIAAAMGCTTVVTGRSSRTIRRTSSSIAGLLRRGQRPIQRIVEAEVVGGHERAGLVGVRADDVAAGPGAADAWPYGCASCGPAARRPPGR